MSQVTTGPSPVIVPPVELQRYLIGCPPGETAFALSCTFGPPASVQALTAVGLDDSLSVSGGLTELTTVGFFCASVYGEMIMAARAIGAMKSMMRGFFLDICTP